MKENKLIEMKNKIETLGGVANQLIREINNIKQLSIGTLETVKLMPGYDKAIEKLKEKAREDSSKEQKLDSLGEDSI
tara:strand:+ start:626 stop:856 length:231 start_codon:yes stop_codon:yes gene_type:complete